jgi:hypothetical protein
MTAGGPTPPRRRLSRGMLTFVVVDAVLLLGFAVVAVLVLTGVLGGGDDGQTAEPASSSAPSDGSSPGGNPRSTPSAPPSGALALQTFALPSGNIACVMSNDGATCTIASISFAPPTDASCTGTIGHVFVVNATGLSIPCVDGPAPAAAPEGTPVLQYGQVSSVGGYTCESAETGVTCRNDKTGQGFALARASYRPLD